MKEYRCPVCKALLFKGEYVGKIEIVCKKCNKKVNGDSKVYVFEEMVHVYDEVGILSHCRADN